MDRNDLLLLGLLLGGSGSFDCHRRDRRRNVLVLIPGFKPKGILIHFRWLKLDRFEQVFVAAIQSLVCDLGHPSDLDGLKPRTTEV